MARRSRFLTAVWIVALAASACTGGAKSNASAVPGGDIGKLFLQKLNSATFSGHYTVDGTFGFGSTSYSVSGQAQFRGWDADETDTVSAGSSQQVTEDISIQGVDYQKLGSGPWVKQNGTTTNPFARLVAVQDLGIEQKDGQPVHHLRPGPDFTFEASDVGLFDVQEFTGSLDFYVKGDGTPVSMAISASWKSNQDQITSTLTYHFSQIGTSVTLSAPSEAWSLFSSKSFHYEIAYPPGWTATNAASRKAFDFLDGPSPTGTHDEVRVAADTIPASWGKKAYDNWVTDAMITNLHSLGKSPENMPAVQIGIPSNATVAGQPADILRYHVKTPQGVRVLFLDAEVVFKSKGYRIIWVSVAGSEAADTAEFRSFLSTFNFT